MCLSPVGQFVYGIIFENIGNYVFLPFYAAAFIVIGMTIFTRRIFYGIDQLTKKTEQTNLGMITEEILFFNKIIVQEKNIL